MFGTEVRESTHDDAPRSEPVRDSIKRAISTLKGEAATPPRDGDVMLPFREISRKSKESDADFEERRKSDNLAGFGPQERAVIENTKRREDTRRSVSPADKNRRELQADHDKKRSEKAAEIGFEKRRLQMNFGDTNPARVAPGTRPNGEVSVAESIFAAMAEHDLPGRIEVDAANPITLGVSAHPDINSKPEHWSDVDVWDFQVLPQTIREEAHRNAPRIKAFIAGRNQYANPKTAEAPFSALLRQLSAQDIGELTKWAPDPNSKAPPLPVLTGIPYGWTQAQWTNAPVSVRNRELANANMLILDDYASKVMADPAMRLTGVKQLIAEYPHLRALTMRYIAQAQQHQQQAQQAAYAQMTPAERTITDWARDKPHYSAVRHEMGRVINEGRVWATPNDPYALDAAYNYVLRANPQLTASGKTRKRASSGLRGGSPSGYTPPANAWEPQRGDSVRQSAQKAFAELRK